MATVKFRAPAISGTRGRQARLPSIREFRLILSLDGKPNRAGETMKGPVLSAWIAAGLVLTASGARAQQADCDLVCRLSGYLSTDHMAAPASSAAAPSPGITAKHHPRVAAAAHKAPSKVAAKAEPPVAAKAPAKRPVEAAAKPPARTLATAEPSAVPEPRRPKAAIDRSKPAKRPAAVAQGSNPDAGAAKPAEHHVAAIATPPDPTSAPPVVAAPRRPRRNASTALLLAQKSASPPGPGADLIPGSARLVPAGFQSFGKL